MRTNSCVGVKINQAASTTPKKTRTVKMTEQAKRSLSAVTLCWPSQCLLCTLILRDWFWQRLLWTKVSGIRYVHPEVHDHWPFNRLGSLKLLVDPPVDLFLMRWDFFLPPKPPFISSSCCVAENPNEAAARLKSSTSKQAGRHGSNKSWKHTNATAWMKRTIVNTHNATVHNLIF